MTPARPQPSSCSANTERRFCAKPGLRLRRLSSVRQDRGLLPTHTRRSEEAQAFQQFSTPIPLGLAAITAAAITPPIACLEPSAGTGLLAILAEIAGGTLVLNELAETRAALISSLFPAIPVTRFDAAQIDDHLDPGDRPNNRGDEPAILGPSPMSRAVSPTPAYRHLASALARLADGGRLVAITGASFGPDIPAWRDAFVRLQESGRVVFTAAVHGSVYAKHGTTVETRLTVIDKIPRRPMPSAFPASPGTRSRHRHADDVDRRACAAAPGYRACCSGHADRPRSRRAPFAAISRARAATSADPRRASPIPRACHSPMRPSPGPRPRAPASATRSTSNTDCRRSVFPALRPIPTKLVQSAAMASVAPPKPSYRPTLASDHPWTRSRTAQLETLIFAGEAHSDFLAGSWTIDDTFDVVAAAADDANGVVRFRRGFFIGDGTGVEKGPRVGQHRARQLDAGPAQGGLDLQIRQAD